MSTSHFEGTEKELQRNKENEKSENGNHTKDNALLDLSLKLVKRSCGFHYGKDYTR